MSALGLASAFTNVLSSIALVVLNKWLFSVEGWRFGTTLIVLHIGTTYAVCEGMACCGVFERKSLSLYPVLQLAIVAVLSTVFMNLSLLYNSLGTYQLSKLMIIPCTISLQYTFWSVQQSANVLLSLLLVVVGVGIATIDELQTNTIGLVFLVVAVVTSTLNQIWMETLQKSLECSPVQLIYRFTPWAFLFSLFVVPLSEDVLGNSPSSLWAFHYHSSTIILILISCLVAGILNISGYLVVGHFSALTYQVIGHVKTLSILLLGVILFFDPIGSLKLIGVLASIGGMVAYAYFKGKTSNAK